MPPADGRAPAVTSSGPAGAQPCRTCGQPRPTVDVEAMLTRVLAAALRELLTPRWWRRLRRAC